MQMLIKWHYNDTDIVTSAEFYRGVAQPGRVLALGARCRVFESRRPDHLIFLSTMIEADLHPNLSCLNGLNKEK